MFGFLEYIFKIVLITYGSFMNFVLSISVLLNEIYFKVFGSGPLLGMENGYAYWTWHSCCGTLLIVLKFKDLCYLHWWLLMTSVYILGGLVLQLVGLDFQRDEFGTAEKVQNYFGLGFMFISLVTVAAYSRSLRSPEDT
ncbi:uncharacterized protein LOC108029880 [Drosophila biarmipes]|uniref:uncharacterized protein LOC108029880 n=1 Tax=Drosophila biarmipes TaxID=125945 RepID=UPI001CDB38CF|nr:uncharacterized protein LOC108029880 [Drosophila biarmipes]